MRIIHLNIQATSVLLSALDGDDYNRVIGFDVAKQIWDTLHLAHEGADKVRRARRMTTTNMPPYPLTIFLCLWLTMIVSLSSMCPLASYLILMGLTLPSGSTR